MSVRRRVEGGLHRWLLAGLPLAWLAIFFLLPLGIVLRISLAEPVLAQPPYSPLFDPGGGAMPQIDTGNYRALFTDGLYAASLLGSLRMAAISTLLCLLVGYPMAYAIARSPQPRRTVLLLLVILPFWSSFLLRVYAWMGLLGSQGAVNALLLAPGLIDAPLQLLYTDAAVYLGMTYSYLPFMVLPLYAVLERQSGELREAAADLGAGPWRVFRDVTLPLSLPGVLAGSLLVFIPATGEFVIPSLLGSIDTQMLGHTVYEEFFVNRDWPLAAALTVVLLAVVLAPLALLQRLRSGVEP
jgi:putrescine transport system permease protein